MTDLEKIIAYKKQLHEQHERLEKVWSALILIREELARLQKSIDNILALKEAK